MSDFLLGIPGKLKTISDYLTTNWTTARAAKVDNLDTAISTRAADATALSTAIWTSTRAGMLDGFVRSVQTGNGKPNVSGALLFYQDVTIASVDLSKSIVLIQPILNNLPSGQVSTLYGRLTSSTNLRMESYSASDESRWTVLEFK